MKPLTPNGGKMGNELMSPDDALKGSGASSSTAATSGTDDKLRRAIEDASARDATAKATLAKSDAVILELRASVRNLKRQLEKMTAEKEQGDALQAKLRQELERLEQATEYHLREEQESHERSLHELKSQLAVSETQARESVVGELQVQLDRAHAQIITSDMVRKELEDTLEAEQYTWELRVQDQERTIVTLSQECRTLREDLEHCRSQWKEAEEGWTSEVQELQSQLQRRASPTSDQSVQPLQERLELLEREREELQSCLDEAMQELEAVDQELRHSPSSGVEALQHLYRWLLERSDQEELEMPANANELVETIQCHIESIPSANLISNTEAALQVAELEAQISVYRGDLKARDEQSNELRASLKEAVALLKPLQDAVAKSEVEKEALQGQLDELKYRQDPIEELQKRDRQIADLQRQIEDLTEDLMQMKTSSPSSPERTSRSLQRSGEPGHEKQKPEPSSAQAKRDSERALQEMLKNAQGRFHALHQENHNVESENHNLRNRVEELEKEREELKVKNEESVRRNIAAELMEAAVQELEQDVKGYKEELQRKEDKVIQLEEELLLAKEAIPKDDKNVEKMEAELEELREAAERVEDLEAELSALKGDLEAKKEAELVLTKSLKQALGLLRPLETHLETAEQKKRELTKQLKACRKQIAKLEAGGSESRALGLPDEVEMPGNNGLTVRQLEQENAKLQNALEEVSQNLSFNGDENNRNQSRLQESLVEVNSRYEVTHDKLERAVLENHALFDSLKQMEADKRKRMAELRKLQEQLMKSNQQLENAKYIATSALMKVEELTMANVEQMSLLGPVDICMDDSSIKSPARRAMQARVKALEIEVENASKVNKAHDGSLEDRERIVQSLTAVPSKEFEEYDRYERARSQSEKARHTGVSPSAGSSRESEEFDPYDHKPKSQSGNTRHTGVSF
jgi:chromosome segregation ATPase